MSGKSLALSTKNGAVDKTSGTSSNWRRHYSISASERWLVCADQRQFEVGVAANQFFGDSSAITMSVVRGVE
jgi:hypothetical protein